MMAMFYLKSLSWMTTEGGHLFVLPISVVMEIAIMDSVVMETAIMDSVRMRQKGPCLYLSLHHQRLVLLSLHEPQSLLRHTGRPADAGLWVAKQRAGHLTGETTQLQV